MPTENDSTMRPSSKPKPPNAAAPEVSGKAPVLASNQSTDTSLSKSTHTPTQPSAEGLPEGWLTSFTEDGRVYYYNVHTRVSRWTPPTDEVAAVVKERLEKSKGIVEDAVQKRKQELEEQRLQKEAAEVVANAVRPEIVKAINAWRQPKNWTRARDIGELLSNLHCIVCSVTQEMIVGNQSLTAQSPPSEIKKAYMRAARVIHPDKIAADMVLEERLIAEQIFVLLTEEYNAYKKAQEAG